VTDVLDGVREHYGATSLTERLEAALGALGPQDLRLTPEQLAALDQFHTRGLAATAELARLAGITAAMSVLDVGAGIGGCDLRRRVEKWRAAFSRPLGAHAGNELSPNRHRDARRN
jgi:hypothetical protein